MMSQGDHKVVAYVISKKQLLLQLLHNNIMILDMIGWTVNLILLNSQKQDLL